MKTFDVLDHPIWSSLTTGHAELARTNGGARRYPSDVSPLAALREPSASAFADLAALVDPGESVALFTSEPIQPPGDWEVVRSRMIEQMTCGESTQTSARLPTLHEIDVPEMMALAAATEPGPFLPATIRMGRYFGIRSDGGRGRLIAMAGERLKPDGFTEISAVCTDPAFRGHGYARALVGSLAARVLEAGETPFLHVKSENGAKSLYERLGFRVRRPIHLTVIARR